MNRERFSKIMMAVMIFLIFAYIFYEVYSVSHVDLVTEEAVVSTVYDKIDAKAIVIRDEQPISKASGGITVPCLKDGDKINVGGNTAMTFASQEAAADYSKYAALQEQLAYYENLESQTLGQVSSVESINSEIKSDLNLYIRAIETGDTATLSVAGDKLNDGLVRRQIIIGEKVDLRSIIQELRQQSEQYSANAKPQNYLTTEVSGVFSSYTDGFESLLDYENAEELTAEQVENAIQEAENTAETDYLGKLITSYQWYIECVLEADQVKNLSNGKTVQLSLKDSNDTVISAEIISGADVNPGQQKTLLVLKCSEMDSTLASLRCEDIEIRVKAYEGIRVPATALHVNEDGEKGVYALVASQMHFRKAEVIFSADNYVLLKYDPGSEGGVRLHDKIITQGKELKEGQVYNGQSADKDRH